MGRFQGSGFFTRGSNFRLTQFQGVLLLRQIEKLVAETARRREAADYLNARLGAIPGITPVRVPAESRGVYHLYPVRYDARQFAGLGRDAFLRALAADGVPGSGVYHEQYFHRLPDEAIPSRGFQRTLPLERHKASRARVRALCATRAHVTNAGTLSQTHFLAPPLPPASPFQRLSGVLEQL